MGGRNGVAWWVGVVGGRGRGWVGEHMDERVLRDRVLQKTAKS